MAAQVFGLDIGRYSIKVVEVNVSSNKKVLVAAASSQTPAGGIQSESPVDIKLVSEAVKKLVDSANLTTNKCSVSLVEAQVLTRLIRMPNLTDKELSAAINWEAEQYIPLPVKDVNLQYQVVNRPDVKEGGTMDVLLVAAPKKLVEKYLNIVKEANLSPNSFEPESIALSRALTKIDDPATVIISIGAVSTEIVVAAKGNIYLTRSIATGGASLTKAVMAELNLPQKQAEEYKMAYGLADDKLSGKVASVLRPIVNILSSEILKAVEYIRANYKDVEINRIVVCGGAAYLPGLGEFLAERSSFEVSLGDPWADFEKEGLILKMAGLGSFYAVSTGLALGS